MLITGGDGFVAPYAAREILNSVEGAEILYSARRPVSAPAGCAFALLDILDAGAVARNIAQFRPTHILHLAGIASRQAAEDDPVAAWSINCSATLRLASVLGALCPGTTFLFVSSSQIHAGNVSGRIDENSPIGPQGVYASTKAAADLALAALASAGMRVVRFRPFNHTGPGQSAAYALGGFAGQIARLENGRVPPVLRAGNLGVQRDFTDVRDIVRAYASAIAQSDKLSADAVFTLASGTARPLAELLDLMLAQARLKIEVQIDPALQRSSESAASVGDFGRARALLGWTPQIPIEQTLREMVEYARLELAAVPGQLQ